MLWTTSRYLRSFSFNSHLAVAHNHTSKANFKTVLRLEQQQGIAQGHPGFWRRGSSRHPNNNWMIKFEGQVKFWGHQVIWRDPRWPGLNRRVPGLKSGWPVQGRVVALLVHPREPRDQAIAAKYGVEIPLASWGERSWSGCWSFDKDPGMRSQARGWFLES